MNVIKDFKGWIALGILVLGTVCTTLALWTDHWYDIKMVTDGYAEENIPGQGFIPKNLTGNYFYHTKGIMHVHEYLGLWKVCTSVKSSDTITPGVTYGLTCFKVDAWKGVKSDATRLTGIVVETDFGANKFQNPYLNTYIMLYPDYLEGIQAMEIIAFLGGVTAIGIWITYIVMSARTKKVVVYTVLWVIAIVLIFLTAVFYVISVLVWVVKKNNEISEALAQSHMSKLPDGMNVSFGWSWGMAAAAALLHLLSIIPLALTNTNKPDDIMERGLL